jgi:hypothetical protein
MRKLYELCYGAEPEEKELALLEIKYQRLIDNGYSNKEFVYSLFEECFGSLNSVYGAKSVMFDAGIVENLTQRESIIYTVALLLIPTIIAITGAVMIVRRKNR